MTPEINISQMRNLSPSIEDQHSAPGSWCSPDCTWNDVNYLRPKVWVWNFYLSIPFSISLISDLIPSILNKLLTQELVWKVLKMNNHDWVKYRQKHTFASLQTTYPATHKYRSDTEWNKLSQTPNTVEYNAVRIFLLKAVGHAVAGEELCSGERNAALQHQNGKVQKVEKL